MTVTLEPQNPHPDSATDETGELGSDRTPTVSVRSNARRLVHAVLAVLSLVLLSSVAVVAAAAVIVPATTGSKTYTILTRSMEPGMPPGTLIVTRAVDPHSLVVGDIITYQLRSGEPEVVTHRIVRVVESSDGSRMFILRGDNNAADDAKPVRSVQIRGKVWYAVPLIGHVAIGTGLEGRAFIVGIGAIALFGYAATQVVVWARRRHA